MEETGVKFFLQWANEWKRVDKSRGKWKRGKEWKKNKEGGRETKKKRKKEYCRIGNRDEQCTESMDLPQFAVQFIEGTFVRKSVLGGIQSICRPL